MKKHHWFDFIEYFSLVGLGAGSVLSIVSKQALFASTPLSFALLVGFANRRRVEQAQEQKLIDSLSVLDRKLSKSIKLVDQQVQNLPTPEMIGEVRQSILRHGREDMKRLSAHIVEVREDLEERLKLFDQETLDKTRQDVTQLRQEYAKVYSSLEDISSSLKQAATTHRVDEVDQAIASLSRQSERLQTTLQTLDDHNKHSIASLQEQVNQVNRQVKSLPPPVDAAPLKRDLSELVRVVADLVPKRDLNNVVADLRTIQEWQASRSQTDEGLRQDIQAVRQRLQSLPDVPQLRSQLEESFTHEIRAINHQLRTLHNSPSMRARIEEVLKEELATVYQQLSEQLSNSPYDLVFDLSANQAFGEMHQAIAGSRLVLEEALEKSQNRLILIWPWSNYAALDHGLLSRMEGYLRQQKMLEVGWCHLSDRHSDRLLSKINRRWAINPLSEGELQGTLKRLLALKRRYPDYFRFKILGMVENFLISDSTFAVLGIQDRLKTQTVLQDVDLKLRTTDDQIIQQLTQRFDQENPAPEDTEAYWNRAVTRYDLGDKGGAIQDLNSILGVASDEGLDEAVVYNLRGIIRYDQKDVTGAIEDLNLSIRLCPDQFSAYCNRGYIQSESGDQAAAITDFDTALDARPDSAIAYFYRAVAYQKSERLDAALRDYSAALDYAADSAVTFYERGQIYRELGCYTEAIADLESAVPLFTEKGQAKNAQTAAQVLTQVQEIAATEPSSPPPPLPPMEHPAPVIDVESEVESNAELGLDIQGETESQPDAEEYFDENTDGVEDFSDFRASDEFFEAAMSDAALMDFSDETPQPEMSASAPSETESLDTASSEAEFWDPESLESESSEAEFGAEIPFPDDTETANPEEQSEEADSASLSETLPERDSETDSDENAAVPLPRVENQVVEGSNEESLDFEPTDSESPDLEHSEFAQVDSVEGDAVEGNAVEDKLSDTSDAFDNLFREEEGSFEASDFTYDEASADEGSEGLEPADDDEATFETMTLFSEGELGSDRPFDAADPESNEMPQALDWVDEFSEEEFPENLTAEERWSEEDLTENLNSGDEFSEEEFPENLTLEAAWSEDDPTESSTSANESSEEETFESLTAENSWSEEELTEHLSLADASGEEEPIERLDAEEAWTEEALIENLTSDVASDEVEPAGRTSADDDSVIRATPRQANATQQQDELWQSAQSEQSAQSVVFDLGQNVSSFEDTAILEVFGTENQSSSTEPSTKLSSDVSLNDSDSTVKETESNQWNREPFSDRWEEERQDWYDEPTAILEITPQPSAKSTPADDSDDSLSDAADTVNVSDEAPTSEEFGEAAVDSFNYAEDPTNQSLDERSEDERSEEPILLFPVAEEAEFSEESAGLTPVEEEIDANEVETEEVGSPEPIFPDSTSSLEGPTIVGSVEEDSTLDDLFWRDSEASESELQAGSEESDELVSSPPLEPEAESASAEENVGGLFAAFDSDDDSASETGLDDDLENEAAPVLSSDEEPEPIFEESFGEDNVGSWFTDFESGDGLKDEPVVDDNIESGSNDSEGIALDTQFDDNSDDALSDDEPEITLAEWAQSPEVPGSDVEESEAIAPSEATEEITFSNWLSDDEAPSSAAEQPVADQAWFPEDTSSAGTPETPEAPEAPEDDSSIEETEEITFSNWFSDGDSESAEQLAVEQEESPPADSAEVDTPSENESEGSKDSDVSAATEPEPEAEADQSDPDTMGNWFEAFEDDAPISLVADVANTDNNEGSSESSPSVSGSTSSMTPDQLSRDFGGSDAATVEPNSDRDNDKNGKSDPSQAPTASHGRRSEEADNQQIGVQTLADFMSAIRSESDSQEDFWAIAPRPDPALLSARRKRERSQDTLRDNYADANDADAVSGSPEPESPQMLDDLFLDSPTLGNQN